MSVQWCSCVKTFTRDSYSISSSVPGMSRSAQVMSPHVRTRWNGLSDA
jgi:hypothetical protein